MLFKENQKIVFTGDSITDCGRRKPDGEGAPVDSPFGNGFVNLFFGYMHSQYPSLHLRIINQGTSGHTSRDLNARYEEILDLNPDWVFVMIGVNDVWRLFDCPELTYMHVNLDEYRQNIEDIIAKTLVTKAKLVILNPFIIEDNMNDPMRKVINEYQKVLKEEADKNKIMFIDIQKAFDDLLLNVTNHEISRDRIHPNVTGHMLIMKAIVDFVENN